GRLGIRSAQTVADHDPVAADGRRPADRSGRDFPGFDVARRGRADRCSRRGRQCRAPTIAQPWKDPQERLKDEQGPERAHARSEHCSLPLWLKEWAGCADCYERSAKVSLRSGTRIAMDATISGPATLPLPGREDRAGARQAALNSRIFGYVIVVGL